MSVVTSAPARARTLSIVSPHDLVTLGLGTMLAELAEPDASPLRLLPADSEEAPDVVLYDVVALLEGDVAELDDWIARPGTTVVALTSPLRPDLGALALDRGAAAAIPWGDSAEEIRAALVEALDVELPQDPLVPHDHGPTDEAPAGLSPRESDVLRLVVRGLSNQQIADELFLSINSVKTYIRSAYRKVGVTSRPQVVSWCLQQGFAPPRSTVGSRDADDRLQGLR
jgi:DNA-binding NarL/FixJ family response regulator